jgi:hypothetical protein
MTWMIALVGLPAAMLIGCADPSAGKIKITKADELPQHTYPFTGNVSQLVKSREQVADLATKVRANIDADLATYDIADPTTVQGMQRQLLTIDMIQGDYDSALKRIKEIRTLEDKEPLKLTTGMGIEAIIAARREVGQSADPQAYKQAFRRHLTKRVDKLPWSVVEDTIQENKGRMEIFSENLLMGIIQAQIEPVVAKTGELNDEQAGSVIGMHLMITERLPLKEETISVYQKMIDANRTVKPDIWAARSVTLSKSENLTPVLVAAWDSGTDPAVFRDLLYSNAAEQIDGKDNDGNGYVDDVHGIAYDIHAKRTTGLLYPLGDAAGRIHEIMKHMKGFTDIQAAVDSPEATALKRHLANLDPAQVKGFIEDLGMAGNHAHGTHVAGIMTAGNPFARLLIARLSYDHRTIPVARTAEWGRRDGQKCRDTVDYFKQHGVRVVNMSWGEAQEDAEESLERNGIGKDADERRDIARKVFALQRDGLYEAIAGAPDILFVGAAGNADNDVEFDEYIPSSFDLPNLLIVGAVDQAGEPTSFTSSGRTVQVYANGFEVDSFVPGGERMKMSGTSMASPNVANLAAKLLAIDPALTPPQIIELIKKGADKKTAGGMTFLLMNPKRTVELLRSS